MKQSKLFIPTLRETSSEIQSESYQLLVKGGFIRQAASGFYSYLPLAVLVLKKIKKIVEEEFEKMEAVEIITPHVVPVELLEKTDRKELFKNDLFEFKDHTDRHYALVATSEEIFSQLVFSEGQSYRRFPYHFYQLQTKFRDEGKIRHGLIRSREFIMADAYSFHTTEEDLETSYLAFEKTFSNIFKECSVSFATVIGDSGIMGGKESKEFVAFSEIGDETIVQSEKGDYVSDYSLAKNFFEDKKNHESLEDFQVLPWNEETQALVSKKPELVLKVYFVDGNSTAFLLPKGREINETKIKNFFDTNKVVEDSSGGVKFFEALKKGEKPAAYFDEESLLKMNPYLVDESRNEAYLMVNANRDITFLDKGDFHYVMEKDLAPDGEHVLEFKTGVEIGHIFKLGDYYAKKLGGFYLDENGNKKDILMGSYGIGISRLFQIIIQQHHDENGVTWPKAVSPFDLHIIPVNVNDKEQMALVADIEERLKETPYTYLVDDRNEHVGVKFADADLIGCVLRITIGKKAGDGTLEITLRQSGEKVEVKKEDLIDILPILYDSAY